MSGAFVHNSQEALEHPEFTDRIFLRKAHDQSAGQNVYTWAGAWPPPPKLILVTERSLLQTKLIDPAMYPQVGDWMAWAKEMECTAVEFTLNSASQLPERAKPEEHWFRDAEYLVSRRD